MSPSLEKLIGKPYPMMLIQTLLFIVQYLSQHFFPTIVNTGSSIITNAPCLTISELCNFEDVRKYFFPFTMVVYEKIF